MDLNNDWGAVIFVELLFGVMALNFMYYSTVLSPVYAFGLVPCLVLAELYRWIVFGNVQGVVA